ncbi:hypothetical protein SAMD00019534_080200 [Acytostelium subglobosum LB1]|uniref:hypothetical protein n=1 Tax=Acytostelium subglobosum LB1 TaxID=1410327 RepID=UPI000644E906|nr:hypothetical protein SAMD00019534_080200 [Acytostelium subglobosum LB1]GAM24845.1 hypothetical protein SAMD00019534_080200 [Acytostelium subglobosum LB1]|eukprot:XP_012751934.1 hypothetical protein SAMD00019534_080200 [Acytostelium subglobosum LB1]
MIKAILSLVLLTIAFTYLPTAAAVQMNQTSCWPFSDAGTTALRGQTKKVFAHYFSQFPIAIDNVDSSNDYYTRNFLNPLGENKAHFNCGGFFRQRPLPRPVRPESNWADLDMRLEVTRAIALGLDGFTYDMLSLTSTSVYWTRLLAIMKAAIYVDPAFKIVLMPDMNAGWASSNASNLIPAIVTLVNSPDNAALYRDASGNLVISAYRANNQSPAWWANLVSTLKTGYNISVVLWPVFPSITSSLISSYGASSVGMSNWDGNCVKNAASFVNAANNLHTAGEKYMSPVMSQNHRPKEFHYWEARNSEAMRAHFMAAINGNAEWIQIITWNDYSEGTEISPSSGTQYSYYDVAAYYLRWYKLGTPPAIYRDAIYYFHRNSLTTQKPDIPAHQTQNFSLVPCDPAVDRVEVLAFLTAPANITITQGGNKVNKYVPAGVQSVTANLIPGSTPVFKVTRNGATIINLTSTITVATTIQIQDLLYRGGGSITCTRPNV